MKASELASELQRMALEMGDPVVMAYAASEDLGPVQIRYEVLGGREVLILGSDMPEGEE